MSRQGRKNARTALRLAIRLHENGHVDQVGLARLIRQTVEILWDARVDAGIREAMA